MNSLNSFSISNYMSFGEYVVAVLITFLPIIILIYVLIKLFQINRNARLIREQLILLNDKINYSKEKIDYLEDNNLKND